MITIQKVKTNADAQLALRENSFMILVWKKSLDRPVGQIGIVVDRENLEKSQDLERAFPVLWRRNKFHRAELRDKLETMMNSLRHSKVADAYIIHIEIPSNDTTTE